MRFPPQPLEGLPVIERLTCDNDHSACQVWDLVHRELGLWRKALYDCIAIILDCRQRASHVVEYTERWCGSWAVNRDEPCYNARYTAYTFLSPDAFLMDVVSVERRVQISDGYAVLARHRYTFASAWTRRPNEIASSALQLGRPCDIQSKSESAMVNA